MRFLPHFILPLMFLALTSCSSEPDATQPKPGEKSTPVAPVSNGVSKKRAYTEEELNRPFSTVSPWRYIFTSPDAIYFKKMVTTSSHSKTVHSAGHTLLVPRDQTFLDNKTWKGIMEPENLDALDRFVAAHIIKGIQSPKGIEGVYEDLNGNTITIESNEDGEQVCGGARLLGQVVETDNGLVIPVMGMVEDFDWN